MFIMNSIRGFKQTYLLWDASGEKYKGNISFFEFGYMFSQFRPILIGFIPLIGVFINRKIGWILIMSYFYFVVFRAIYSTIYSLYEESFTLIYLALALLIFIPFILILNIVKISDGIYGIKKSDLIKNNIIATLVGLTITLIIL